MAKKQRLVPGLTLIFRVRWMEAYDGPEDGLGRSLFAYLRKNPKEIGGERFNFKARNGVVRAYVAQDSINFGAMGVPPEKSVDGVTVVFIATPPSGGTRIVGWYENATVYSTRRGRDGNTSSPYLAATSADNAYLIPVGLRNFGMPKGKGYPGQSRVTYISKLNPQYETNILDALNRLVKDGLKSVSQGETKRSRAGILGKADQALKRRVELAAISTIWSIYEKRGEDVHSVERDNVGWDLETKSGLRIEVKGRHGAQLSSELSPNEYEKFQEASKSLANARTYRLAIVGNALSAEPDIMIFSYVGNEWRCEVTDGSLSFTERVGAGVTGHAP